MRGVSRGGGAVCREINKLQGGRKTRRFQFGRKVRRRGDELAFSMKTLSPPASPKHRTVRRVSKPLMEKRRRERINHSLETLRLLMLENTHDEKLKNPKVEKAEILESVVQFLKTEKEVEKGHRAMKRLVSREQRQLSARQHSYNDGMRSCLLRVSHFIASRSQESDDAGGVSVQASLSSLPGPQTYPSSPGHIHRPLIPAAVGGDLCHHHGISHPYLTQNTDLHCDTRKLLSPTAASTHITDTVWRPWPQ